MKCKPDIMLLNVFWSILWKGASGQFYEKRLLVRERYMKLLLETVTYIAIKERVTCIITMQTVMRIMLCRKYHLHKCNRDTHLDNYNKNCHPHICCRNRKIYQHTSNRKYHLKTCIIAIKCQLHISNRDCHLQNWLQKLSLAEMVPVWDSLS